MPKPIVFGSDYSVYVRIARLCLIEKGIDHDLVPIDIFAEGGAGTHYLERQPFGKIPAFEHEGFRLYETGAMTRYIDEAFAGSPLQPADVKLRARMNQIVSIADHYIYPELVWGMYVELVSKVAAGECSDMTRVAKAREKVPLYLNVLREFLADKPWFCDRSISLADLYLAPMFDYFMKIPEGHEAISGIPGLDDWWRRISSRPSMLETQPDRSPVYQSAIRPD